MFALAGSRESGIVVLASRAYAPALRPSEGCVGESIVSLWEDHPLTHTVYVGVIVICLVAAVIVSLATRSRNASSFDNIPEGRQVWVKCVATCQMDKREFLEQLVARTRENLLMGTLRLPCKQ